MHTQIDMRGYELVWTIYFLLDERRQLFVTRRWSTFFLLYRRRQVRQQLIGNYLHPFIGSSSPRLSIEQEEYNKKKK